MRFSHILSLLTFLGLSTAAWLVPAVSLAQTIPQASDIVVVYENADIEQQARYNFLFTVEGDAMVYPCEANRCSTEPFRDKSSINITLYKLPDGFPRPQGIPDQAKLREFIQLSEQQYTLSNIQPNLQTSGSERPYYEAQLSSNGKVKVNLQSYTKPVEEDATLSTKRTALWVWIVGLAVGIAVLVATAILGRKYIMNKRVEY
jgi:hypothetical protein